MPQVIQRHLGDRCLLSTLRKAPALKGPKTLKCFQGSLIRQLIPISKLPGAVRSIAHPIPERCANILPCPALPPPSLLPLTSRPVAWAGEHQLRLTSLRFGLSQFPAEVSLPLFQESLPAQWKDLGSELKITGPQPPAGSIKSPAKSGKQARPQDGMGFVQRCRPGPPLPGGPPGLTLPPSEGAEYPLPCPAQVSYHQPVPSSAPSFMGLSACRGPPSTPGSQISSAQAKLTGCDPGPRGVASTAAQTTCPHPGFGVDAKP